MSEVNLNNKNIDNTPISTNTKEIKSRKVEQKENKEQQDANLAELSIKSLVQHVTVDPIKPISKVWKELKDLYKSKEEEISKVIQEGFKPIGIDPATKEKVRQIQEKIIEIFEESAGKK